MDVTAIYVRKNDNNCSVCELKIARMRKMKASTNANLHRALVYKGQKQWKNKTVKEMW